jgi:hypothetical protein
MSSKTTGERRLGGGADRDDARPGGGRERAVQAGGQGEVAEVVGGELHLPAFGGAHQRGGHQPGVVDQDVQRARPVRGEGAHGCLVGEVERGDQDRLVAGAGDDVPGGAVARLFVADGEGDLGAGTGQRAGGLDADAGGPAGHDGPAAGQIDAVHDLGGRGLCGERGGDPFARTGRKLRELVSSSTKTGLSAALTTMIDTALKKAGIP